MAFVGGVVSKKDRLMILAAGYAKHEDNPMHEVLKGMEPFCKEDEVPTCVWVNCEVIDLLSLDENNE